MYNPKARTQIYINSSIHFIPKRYQIFWCPKLFHRIVHSEASSGVPHGNSQTPPGVGREPTRELWRVPASHLLLRAHQVHETCCEKRSGWIECLSSVSIHVSDCFYTILKERERYIYIYISIYIYNTNIYIILIYIYIYITNIYIYV